ncbi:DUF4249 domain-containing protein [Flavobacterium sp.]|uniref:DUF4249 domain-containing protein n=1 Tax=Flavobacterium sp. TaxID=239 RepID=UPI002B4AC135|nr:DUF4249 domain-containing protein [Flavobacterium sp.]HLF52210.1 DUF4249 domain-containing protein [Flavobacterium sp.]
MKKIIFIKTLTLLLLSILIVSCTEPYALQTNTFEEAIVVEASITNEFKKQEIKISRTYRFEENGPTFETGATVIITDDQGNTYDFEEQSEMYISTSEFQAVPDRQYKLNITTADGKTYQSNNQTLTTANQIESLIPTVVTKGDGERGVQINVNSFDPTNTSKYYRYTYEETYKVIVPKWSPNDLYYNSLSNAFELSIRDPNTRICYSSVNSNTNILTSTNEQSEDRVNFPVRFISDQNYIISHRYSILVKQYVQNLESHTFYKTLKDLSSSGSILSQNQPGFFYGNIRAIENPNEKVIGFFDVSSVSTKRMFFNYADLFPDEPLPPYFNDCHIVTFNLTDPGPPSTTSELINAIENNTVRYFAHGYPEYHMVIPVCGDCTSFSSNIIPSFWIE